MFAVFSTEQSAVEASRPSKWSEPGKIVYGTYPNPVAYVKEFFDVDHVEFSGDGFVLLNSITENSEFGFQTRTYMYGSDGQCLPIKPRG
jgi:hypothetical protein